jgi:LysM repeat protein
MRRNIMRLFFTVLTVVACILLATANAAWASTTETEHSEQSTGVDQPHEAWLMGFEFKRTAQQTVVVESGDTLTQIAERFSTTVQRLFSANPEIEHPDIILAGQSLRIPEPDEELDERHMPPPPRREHVSTSRSSSAHTGTPTGDSSHATSPGSIKYEIRRCESSHDYTADNPNSTASGGYGFLDSTWQSTTGLPGRAKDYPPEVQDEAFNKLYAQEGTRPWRASQHCWG